MTLNLINPIRRCGGGGAGPGGKVTNHQFFYNFFAKVGLI